MGHPVLRAAARAVERSEITGPAMQKLIDDMMETMAEYRGVGLAAPQVHQGIRLFVAQLDTEDDSPSGDPSRLSIPRSFRLATTSSRTGRDA